MSSRRRPLTRVVAGAADRNIRFDALCGLLRTVGFHEWVRGSHHIFTREGVAEVLNLQPRDGGLAKPYQARHAPDAIVRYKLVGEVDR